MSKCLKADVQTIRAMIMPANKSIAELSNMI